MFSKGTIINRLWFCKLKVISSFIESNHVIFNILLFLLPSPGKIYIGTTVFFCVLFSAAVLFISTCHYHQNVYHCLLPDIVTCAHTFHCRCGAQQHELFSGFYEEEEYLPALSHHHPSDDSRLLNICTSPVMRRNLLLLDGLSLVLVHSFKLTNYTECLHSFGYCHFKMYNRTRYVVTVSDTLKKKISKFI